MKIILFLPLIISLLLALGCEKEKTAAADPYELTCPNTPVFKPNTYPQKWQLYRTIGSFIGSVQEGTDMEWQESYTLQADSTYLKKIDREGQIQEIEGTFVINQQGEDIFLLLTPNDDTIPVGNCDGSPAEQLWLKCNNAAQGTWHHCDGLATYYRRIE